MDTARPGAERVKQTAARLAYYPPGIDDWGDLYRPVIGTSSAEDGRSRHPGLARERDVTHVGGYSGLPATPSVTSTPSAAAYASIRKRDEWERLNQEEEGQTSAEEGDEEELRPRKSARLRGEKAPYIRTSLSPEAQTRKSRRRHTDHPPPNRSGERHDAICLSSDSEDDGPAKDGRLNSASSEAAPVSAPPGKPRFILYKGLVGETSTKEIARDAQPPPPDWIVATLRVLVHYPGVSEVKLYYTGLAKNTKWAVKCGSCDKSKMTIIEPEDSTALDQFFEHVKGKEHSRTVGATNLPSGTAAASTSPLQNKSKKKHKLAPTKPMVTKKPEDAVSRFLEEVGLSEDLADVMRSVGILDELRMKALGRLPEGALDKFGNELAAAGLDIVARLLILEGLKRRAASAS